MKREGGGEDGGYYRLQHKCQLFHLLPFSCRDKQWLISVQSDDLKNFDKDTPQNNYLAAKIIWTREKEPTQYKRDNNRKRTPNKLQPEQIQNIAEMNLL